MATESTDEIEIIPLAQEGEYLAAMSVTLSLIAAIFAGIWLVLMVSHKQENLIKKFPSAAFDDDSPRSGVTRTAATAVSLLSCAPLALSHRWALISRLRTTLPLRSSFMSEIQVDRRPPGISTKSGIYFRLTYLFSSGLLGFNKQMGLLFLNLLFACKVKQADTYLLELRLFSISRGNVFKISGAVLELNVFGASSTFGCKCWIVVCVVLRHEISGAVVVFIFVFIHSL
jgi:hypothetical protein